MPIAESHFRGGGHYSAVSNGTVASRAGTRVYRFDSPPNIGNVFFNLPNMAARAEWQAYHGLPYILLLNTGAKNVTVRTHTLQTVGTLTSGGHWAMCAFVNGSWVFRTGRIVGVHGSAVPFSVFRNPARPAITNPETAPVFDPFCFLGDDCEYLKTQGQEPLLDVVCPMFQDVTVHAENYNREPIRAADVIMPKLIAARFEDGCFELDENHPWSGTYSLSPEFFAALYKTATAGSVQSEPHVLEYSEADSGQLETSHWNHLTYEDPNTAVLNPAWVHGTGSAVLEAWKYVWRADIPYGPVEAPEAYTLTLLLIAEHTMSAELPAECSEAGPASGTFGAGAKGTIFTLAIFTDELNGAWQDGVSTFQPAGWDGAHTFTMFDPAVSAAAYSYQDGGSVPIQVARKGVHPQCVAIAQLPTTLQAPIGRNHVPLINRTNFKRFQGSPNGLARNLERLYDVPNGAPFLDTGTCNETFLGAPLDHRHGILYNCVFGHFAGNELYGAAMTLGGDILRSRPLEWLAWENAQGTGVTFLRPSKPGWNSICGHLDVEGGSCGSISICVEDGDCSEGAENCGDNGEWPVCEDMSRCDGHPQEKFEGVGGTHTVFRNAAGVQGPYLSGTVCCVPIQSTASGANQMCQKWVDKFGGPTGSSSCVVKSLDADEGCLVKTIFASTFEMPLHDYTLQPNGLAADRRIQWQRILPDPDRPLRDFVFEASAPGFSDLLGTFDISADPITNTALSGSSDLRAHLRWDGTGGENPWEWFGFEIRVNFLQVTTVPHAVGALNTTGTGILLVVSVSGGDLLVELVKFVSRTRSAVLASQTIVGAGSNDEGAAVFRFHGTAFSARYTPAGGSEVELTGEGDKDLFTFADQSSLDTPAADSGCELLPSLAVEGTATGAEFGSLEIDDLVSWFSHHYGSLGSDNISVALAEELLAGYGKCADVSANYTSCGTQPHCNCTRWLEQLITYTHASLSGGDFSTLLQFQDCFYSDSVNCNKDAVDGNADSGAGHPPRVTFLGSPPADRCKCRQIECIDTAGTVCPRCLGIDLPRVMLAVPKGPIWDTQDPGCWGDTPLLCNGIVGWTVATIACE